MRAHSKHGQEAHLGQSIAPLPLLFGGQGMVRTKKGSAELILIGSVPQPSSSHSYRNVGTSGGKRERGDESVGARQAWIRAGWNGSRDYAKV